MCRCGVKKPDYPSVRDKCYCLEKKPGPERSDAGDGVKNGFWHKMEVLSLPWHQDLFWPNTSMFKVRLVTHFFQELGANTDRIAGRQEVVGEGVGHDVLLKQLQDSRSQVRAERGDEVSAG